MTFEDEGVATELKATERRQKGALKRLEKRIEQGVERPYGVRCVNVRKLP